MPTLWAAPVIATKGYVDSGLASKADIESFQSFTDFQTRAEGFATSEQGAKADASLPLSGGTMTGNLFINTNKDVGYSSGLRISSTIASPLIHFTKSGAASGTVAGDITMILRDATKFEIGNASVANWPALEIKTADNTVLLKKDPTTDMGAATKRYVDGKQTALTANTNAYDVILGQSAGAVAGVQPMKLSNRSFIYAKSDIYTGSTNYNDYEENGLYQFFNTGKSHANRPPYGSWPTMFVFGNGADTVNKATLQLAVMHNTENLVQWRARNNSVSNWTEWKVLGRSFPSVYQALGSGAGLDLVDAIHNSFGGKAQQVSIGSLSLTASTTGLPPGISINAAGGLNFLVTVTGDPEILSGLVWERDYGGWSGVWKFQKQPGNTSWTRLDTPNYSSAEQAIGRKWINGKEIWSKTISGTYAINEAAYTSIGTVSSLIPGATKIIKAEGVTAHDGATPIGVRISGDSVMALGFVAGMVSQQWNITVEYIK